MHHEIALYLCSFTTEDAENKEEEEAEEPWQPYIPEKPSSILHGFHAKDEGKFWLSMVRNVDQQ